MIRTKQVKVPTVSQLARICVVADPMMEAWICCQKDSGLRVCDLLSVSRADVELQMERGVVPLHIIIRQKMSGRTTNTFFGSNAIDALKEYLPKDRGSELFPVSRRVISSRLRKLGLKAYSLRHFFAVRMVEAGLPLYMLGELMGYQRGQGFFPWGNLTEVELIQTYMKAYDYININVCEEPTMVRS